MVKYPERQISVTKYIAVFAVTILLFVAGLLFGQFLTNQKYKDIQTIDKSLRLELSDLEVQNSLAESYPCNSFFIYSLGGKLDDLGNKLILLENQIGKNDKLVIELKKPYTLLLIKHYLLIKERANKCNEEYATILFFYSNKPEFIDTSEKQGYLLGYFGNKYGYDKVKVYSIDGDLDLGTVNALKNIYNITYFPTTVVNDFVFIGFHDKEELEKYL